MLERISKLLSCYYYNEFVAGRTCHDNRRERFDKYPHADECNHIPIYAMMSNAFEEDRRKAPDSCLNGYSTKPIGIANLISVLKDDLHGQTFSEVKNEG